MENLLNWLKEYNVWYVLLATILINIKAVVAFVKGVLERLIPSWQERRAIEEKAQKEQKERDAKLIQAETEREKHEQTVREQERLDTILALKDILLSYREELDDAKRERRELQRTLYEFVGKYERLTAQVVEVLRDVSDLQRTALDYLRRMENYGRDDRTTKKDGG